MRWLDGIIDSMDMSLIKLEDGEGQGKLVYCSPWGLKESDTTEGLNKYFLAAPPLFLHSLPSLISNCLNLPFEIQKRSWRLNETYFQQIRSGSQKGLVLSSVETTPEQRSPRICFSPMLGTRDHRRQEKQASFRQEEAANRPVFGSLYLQGMG